MSGIKLFRHRKPDREMSEGVIKNEAPTIFSKLVNIELIITIYGVLSKNISKGKVRLRKSRPVFFQIVGF